MRLNNRKNTRGRITQKIQEIERDEEGRPIYKGKRKDKKTIQIKGKYKYVKHAIVTG